MAKEPDRIRVQHILISFAGAGTPATRSKAEAEKLAGETLARAKKGDDFDGLVRELTDDSPPGIYGMCNRGQRAKSAGEYERDGMVPAFGNVGFVLEVGGIGMAAFDARTSPYGWHIIKRLT